MIIEEQWSPAQISGNDAKPYSLEEIENMIHAAEKEFMSGDFYTTEDVLRYCAEER